MTRYLEIYEDIRKKIVSGVYAYGSKLPSKRVTAENYAVSVITALHAYELLIEEGYVASREKSGYFVSYKENESFSDSFSKASPDRMSDGIVSPVHIPHNREITRSGKSEEISPVRKGD